MKISITNLKNNSVWAFAIIVTIVVLLVLLHPSDEAFRDALAAMCVNFRAPVTIFCYLCLAILLFLVFSKYGSIRLGGNHAKKEYSTFSWLACLFMAGCGIGIVFYCQEPILHYFNNPYNGNVEGSKIGVAYSLTLFNWTINCWSQYGLLGVTIAYFFFNYNKKLKLSSILPDKSPLWIKNSVDIILALGVMAGLTTSMGLGVAQICNGLNYVFGLDVNPYALMGVITLVSTWSLLSGLQKGVKILSNISFILVAILLLSIIAIGIFALDIYNFLVYIGEGSWLLFRNFINYNDFYNSETTQWAASYPIFFELWFAAWAAFVAVYVARISKGRTIREFILGVVGIPTFFTVIWFGIFGTIGYEFRDLIHQTMESDISTAVFIFFHQISPSFYHALSIIVFMIICLFFITSADSGSYVIASLLSNSVEPQTKDKMLWGATLGVVAICLFACGGLALVQSVSVIMGIIVMALICVGSVIFLKTIFSPSFSNKLTR